MLDKLANRKQKLLMKLKSEQMKCNESNMGYAFIFFDKNSDIDDF
jgi:hypothetical protein